jgi:hypothetical protein
VADPKDVQQVDALQDAIKVSQRSAGKFEVSNWDQVTQKKVREALLALGSTLPDSKGMFGTKDQVDPGRRLIGAAMAWGGNPERTPLILRSRLRITTIRFLENSPSGMCRSMASGRRDHSAGESTGMS